MNIWENQTIQYSSYNLACFEYFIKYGRVFGLTLLLVSGAFRPIEKFLYASNIRWIQSLI